MCCEYQINEVLVHIMYSRSFKCPKLILNIYTLFVFIVLKTSSFLAYYANGILCILLWTSLLPQIFKSAKSLSYRMIYNT